MNEDLELKVKAVIAEMSMQKFQITKETCEVYQLNHNAAIDTCIDIVKKHFPTK